MMVSSASSFTLAAIGLVPVVYIFISLYQWISMRLRVSKQVAKFPGPERERFFGNIRQIPRQGEKRMKWLFDNTNRFNKYFSIQFGPVGTALFVCHPDPIKQIIKNGPPKLLFEGSGYGLLVPWLGKGLLINNGDGWFRNRRLLTPAFHFDVLKPYIKIYNESADQFLDKMAKGISSPTCKDGILDIYGDVSLCTLNVMMRCAFSCDTDIQKEGGNNQYVKSVEEMTFFVLDRFFKPWLYRDSLYSLTENGKKFFKACKYAHRVAYELINKRRKQLSNDDTAESIASKRAIDFLDILLLARDEDGQSLSDKEIRCEVDTFLFEGHDTTASAISWCMYNIASHPEYQSKARAEIDELLSGRDSDYIIWDDVGKLPYLTMCIKESMRHVPPVPMVMRQMEQPMELDGVHLLPGTVFAISAHNLHHNPAVWGEDHMEYKPDRFLHENIKLMDSHAYLPFSAGPRNCIGQNFAMNEIKVIMARILHRFILDIDPSQPPQINALITTRSDNGIHVKFTPRNI